MKRITSGLPTYQELGRVNRKSRPLALSRNTRVKPEKRYTAKIAPMNRGAMSRHYFRRVLISPCLVAIGEGPPITGDSYDQDPGSC